MSYQLGIPAALRRYGLTVETVAGWETRGSSTFNPRGVVCHWTAGPKTGDRPSLRIVIHGRTDLPGPLCNVFLTRAGVAVVVAAGRANHAGTGGWNGLTGNSSVFGIEAEASGNEWTEAQRSAYPRVVAALVDLAGGNVDNVCGHYEWATPAGRKVDISGYTMELMRAQVAELQLGGKPVVPDVPPPVAVPKIEGVKPRAIDWRSPSSTFVRIIQEISGASVDGVLGRRTIEAVKRLQRRLGIKVDGIFGPGTAEAYLLSVPNLYKGRGGMPSGAVKLLQWIVRSRVDGQFGDLTVADLKSAQVWAGLEPDGNAGPETKRRITF